MEGTAILHLNNLNWGSNSNYDTHISGRAHSVRFADIRHQDIPGLGRHLGPVGAKEKPLTLNHLNTELAVKLMGMDRKGHAFCKVEINDSEIGGIMHKKFVHFAFGKLPGRIKIDFLHGIYLQYTGS